RTGASSARFPAIRGRRREREAQDPTGIVDQAPQLRSAAALFGRLPANLRPGVEPGFDLRLIAAASWPVKLLALKLVREIILARNPFLCAVIVHITCAVALAAHQLRRCIQDV